MAKRSGTSATPLIAMTAPRWLVSASQQPLTATQPAPRNGGAMTTAGACPTAAAGPVKVTVAGSGSVGGNSAGLPSGPTSWRVIVTRGASVAGRVLPAV